MSYSAVLSPHTYLLVVKSMLSCCELSGGMIIRIVTCLGDVKSGILLTSSASAPFRHHGLVVLTVNSTPASSLIIQDLFYVHHGMSMHVKHPSPNIRFTALPGKSQKDTQICPGQTSIESKRHPAVRTLPNCRFSESDGGTVKRTKRNNRRRRLR